MRKLFLLIALVLIAGWTEFVFSPAFATHEVEQANIEQQFLNQDDIAFLEWIIQPGSKEFYVWQESQKRKLTQDKIDFLNWIITPGAKDWFVSQFFILGQDIILNNGVIKLILSNEHGGSITHLSLLEGSNLINNYDKGRQVQQSYYAGENLTFPDQHPAWSPWPWNPIQSGDVYGNSAKMIPKLVKNNKAIIITTPMFWDRNNVYVACASMETDVQLFNNRVKVGVKFITTKSCEIINPRPRHQEMPAVYAIGDLNNLMSYVGNDPCTNKPAVNITKKRESGPWDYWPSVEYEGEIETWAGAFDDKGYGLGIVMRDVELFIGGRHTPYFYIKAHTTYFSPLKTIQIEPGDVVSYEYWLIVGSINEVRDFACEQ